MNDARFKVISSRSRHVGVYIRKLSEIAIRTYRSFGPVMRIPSLRYISQLDLNYLEGRSVTHTHHNALIFESGIWRRRENADTLNNDNYRIKENIPYVGLSSRDECH